RIARFALADFLEATELQIAARGIFESLALELTDLSHHPLVNALGHEQHFNTAGLQALDVGTCARRRERIGDHVVNAVLAGLHALDVLLERNALLAPLFRRARKTQEREDLLAIAVILCEPFLQHRAELFPEG